MVIPWLGFPLSALLNEVEPASGAQYVRFETLYDPERMPGQNSPFFPWPYIEGLRLDEAMNDLTLISTGLYGEQLLPQNGAPLRLVVPWKYGFKSIKSIVKIDLVDEMPTPEDKVMEAYYYKGMTFAEIGKELGMGETTAFECHARAMRRLRKLFGSDGD